MRLLPKTPITALTVIKLFLGSLFSVTEVTAHAAVPCPPMPSAITTINRDTRAEIEASVGSLGKAKAGEISIKTEIIANNLFNRYPNVDRILAIQTMSSTYCMLLNGAAIADTDRLARWEKFQDKAFLLLSPEYKGGSNPLSKSESIAPPKAPPTQEIKSPDTKRKAKTVERNPVINILPSVGADACQNELREAALRAAEGQRALRDCNGTIDKPPAAPNVYTFIHDESFQREICRDLYIEALEQLFPGRRTENYPAGIGLDVESYHIQIECRLKFIAITVAGPEYRIAVRHANRLYERVASRGACPEQCKAVDDPYIDPHR